MASDPQSALERLIAALETHFAAIKRTEDPDSLAVLEAEDALRNAFFTYDNVLFTAEGAELPFDILEEDDDDESDDEDDDEDVTFFSGFNLDDDIFDDDDDDDEDDE